MLYQKGGAAESPYKTAKTSKHTKTRKSNDVQVCPELRSLLDGPGAERILAIEFLNTRLGKEGLGLGLAGMLISQSVNLGRTRAHDVIRRRNILLGRLSSHLGLEYLAVVFHALNVLVGVLLVHGGVDVLVTEDG
uniref:Uncharacterized protein n=1 Tax=Photinus pyralis TaxID=7054 RepID=A0A1Y1KJH8_PHOPY